MDRLTFPEGGSRGSGGEQGTGKVFARPVLIAGTGAIMLLGLAALVESGPAFVLGVWENWHDEAETSSGADGRQDEIRFVETMNVDDKSQIIAEGEGVQERNAKIPVSKSPLEKANGLVLSQLDRKSGRMALRCMTQAVYYEAALEPLKGRRAVAQTVLNRVRHPAYPNSVCGVVYQGSSRRTGCQFSFTCDGSLLRQPAAAAWREAEKVARDALSGYVEASIGTATHYHADYVLPKWAYQLGKITQLGAHIFYRFNGSSGTAGAFSSRYSGFESIPRLNLLALRERLETESMEQFTPGLTVTPHVTDRHAENDVGGRLDVTKEWRLSIPDPVSASSRYRAAVQPHAGKDAAVPTAGLAYATDEQTVAPQ